jgi:hypothetical protein
LQKVPDDRELRGSPIFYFAVLPPNSVVPASQTSTVLTSSAFSESGQPALTHLSILTFTSKDTPLIHGFLTNRDERLGIVIALT